jgi:hypothetical protein
MTTAITPFIPPAVQQAVQPKPTKSEIVEALVQLRIQEINKKNADLKVKIEKLSVSIKKALLKFVLKRGAVPEASIVYNLGYQHSTSGVSYVSVKFDEIFNLLPGDVKAALIERLKLEKQMVRYERADLVKEIREKLEQRGDSMQRVNALLSDKSSRTALQLVLDHMNGKKLIEVAA